MEQPGRVHEKRDKCWLGKEKAVLYCSPDTAKHTCMRRIPPDPQHFPWQVRLKERKMAHHVVCRQFSQPGTERQELCVRRIQRMPSFICGLDMHDSCCGHCEVLHRYSRAWNHLYLNALSPVW